MKMNPDEGLKFLDDAMMPSICRDLTPVLAAAMEHEGEHEIARILRVYMVRTLPQYYAEKYREDGTLKVQ